MTPKISPKMREVLVYLERCHHASSAAIKNATGATLNTIVALDQRGLIDSKLNEPVRWPPTFTYSLSDAGRKAAEYAILISKSDAA